MADKHLEATAEEMEHALKRYRDFNFGVWLSVAVELAAREHPELLRSALAKVFDLSAIDEMTQRLLAVASAAQAKAAEARAEAGRLHAEVAELRRQLDSLSDHIQNGRERRSGRHV